jgi:hypothetical protein
MEQPPGFKDSKDPDHVWEVLKSLYGMRQAGQVWNKTFDGALVNKLGFKRVSVEHCLYVRSSPDGKSFAIASIHVDDTFAIGSSEEEMDRLQRDLESKWQISVADRSFILGIHLERECNKRLVHLLQTALIDKVIKKFGQGNASPVYTPMESSIEISVNNCPVTPEDKADMANVPYCELIGSLQYIAQGTRPDICYAVGRLAKFMANPGRKHWNAGICMLHYLKTTRLYCLTLGGTPGKTHITGNVKTSPKAEMGSQTLAGMTDSDFAGCKDTQRSVSGYAFTLGSGVISWKSQKQDLVTLSTCEAEFVAASEATCEAVFIRNLLSEIGHTQETPTEILADNQGTIVLVSDQTNHSRTKHIDIRY